MSQTTKRALEASLKKLLLEKPLNKITINDITEDCGVNRMTFYYHFKDIYDLVDWIMVEDAQQAMEGRKDIDDWDKAFLDVLLKIQENKLLVLNVYRSISQEQVEQYLYKIVDPLLHEFADKETQDISIQDEDKQFVIDFFKYALVGMVLEAAKKANIPMVLCCDNAAQPSMVESYARQLRIYKGAVEKRLGVAVKKLTLYAVALRREVDVPLEEAQGHGAGV